MHASVAGASAAAILAVAPGAIGTDSRRARRSRSRVGVLRWRLNGSNAGDGCMRWRWARSLRGRDRGRRACRDVGAARC